MLEGRFVEDPADLHVALRAELLGVGSRLSQPDERSQGVSVDVRSEPLEDHAFLTLGRDLGTPMPETDPAVQPYVEQEVILNLVTEYAPTDDVSLQPFAANYLTLHTESSARKRAEQPRFIVLMCVEPGDEGANAQTVIVPMHDVAERLSREQLELLCRTRYARPGSDGTLARRDGDCVVFSFRDFAAQELAWTCSDESADANHVNGAIRALLAAMYAPELALGVRWQRGMIVSIDNARIFHGRTAGNGASSGRPRHLKRLRILAEDGDAPG